MLAAVRSGTNITAAGLRGLAAIAALTILFTQVGVLGTAVSLSPADHLVAWAQVLIASLAVLIACYLYCFRTGSWEKGVEVLTTTESAHVDALGETSQSIAKDDEGAKL